MSTVNISEAVNAPVVFTPTMFGNATGGSTTYTEQLGVYVRFGRFVFFHIRVAWSATTATGDIIIGGFPFTSANLGVGTEQICAAAADNLTFSGQLIGRFDDASTILRLMSFASGGVVTGVSMDSAAGVTLTGCMLTS